MSEKDNIWGTESSFKNNKDNGFADELKEMSNKYIQKSTSCILVVWIYSHWIQIYFQVFYHNPLYEQGDRQSSFIELLKLVK